MTMQISREPQAYRPITIVLETDAEYSTLVQALGRMAVEGSRSAERMQDSILTEVGAM